jgi:hypothetical protein
VQVPGISACCHVLALGDGGVLLSSLQQDAFFV